MVQSLVMGAALFRQRSQDNFYSLYSFFLLHFVGIPVPRDGGRHEPFFCRTVGVEAARKGYNLIYLASFYSEKVPSNLGLPTLCVVRNRKTRASWCRIHPSWSWQGGWIHRFTGSNSTFQWFSAHFPQGAKGVCWVYVGWALLGCQSMTNDLDFVCDPLKKVFLNGLYMFITFLHHVRPLFALALRHFISMALQRWA